MKGCINRHPITPRLCTWINHDQQGNIFKLKKLIKMSNELAKIEFNKEQIELIKSQVAPKATDNELKLFLYHCQRTGLDPLARQVYAIKRKAKDDSGNWIEKMTIQTSIDGFRVVAERSGSYAGQDEPIFVENGTQLVCCKVTVYRFNDEIRYPAAVGVAYWNEYVPKDGQDLMWKKMPHTMLSKVAEALALRKAFPQDLSGLYTNDEMVQADTPPIDVKHEVINTPAEKVVLIPSPAELAAAIANLELCETKKDLTDLKKSTPAYIVADASFHDAAMKKYNLIMAAKPAPAPATS